MHKLIKDRRDELIGKEFETTNSGKCFVVDYKGRHDVTVVFHKPFYITKCSLGLLWKGYVKNPMHPSVFQSGYLGVGKYSRKNLRLCTMWKHLIERCCSEPFKEVNVHYKDATVCEEWLNFQNFAEWCEKQEFFNAKDDSGRVYHLDKDILVKGNKHYSPETCCFVPHIINTLIISRKACRGSLPIGVCLKNKTYVARLNGAKGKEVYLGAFKSPVEAFLAYKDAKESLIKEVVEQWKDRIPNKVYEKLLKHKVTLDD